MFWVVKVAERVAFSRHDLLFVHLHAFLMVIAPDRTSWGVIFFLEELAL